MRRITRFIPHKNLLIIFRHWRSRIQYNYLREKNIKTTKYAEGIIRQGLSNFLNGSAFFVLSGGAEKKCVSEYFFFFSKHKGILLSGLSTRHCWQEEEKTRPDAVVPLPLGVHPKREKQEVVLVIGRRKTLLWVISTVPEAENAPFWTPTNIWLTTL